MWEYRARDPEAPVPCPYALELRATAQEIFARITETATQDTFARCQQSLLSRYWELAERVQQDWAHFPTPRTGRHWCLRMEYEQAYHRLINLAILSEQHPAPREPLRTLEAVVRDLGDPFQPHPEETPLGIDEPFDPEPSP